MRQKPVSDLLWTVSPEDSTAADKTINSWCRPSAGVDNELIVSDDFVTKRHSSNVVMSTVEQVSIRCHTRPVVNLKLHAMWTRTARWLGHWTMNAQVTAASVVTRTTVLSCPTPHPLYPQSSMLIYVMCQLITVNDNKTTSKQQHHIRESNKLTVNYRLTTVKRKSTDNHIDNDHGNKLITLHRNGLISI